MVSGFVEFVESDIIPLIPEVQSNEVTTLPSPVVQQETATAPTTSAEAKIESATETNTVLRDPFWPAGYTPPPVQARGEREPPSAIVAPPVAAEPRWDEALKTVAVQGIMKTRRGYVAMVNGEVVGTNDTVSVRFEGREYRWKVAAVEQQGVSFARVEDGVPLSEQEQEQETRINAN